VGAAARGAGVVGETTESGVIGLRRGTDRSWVE
jgi:hypothetical protein